MFSVDAETKSILYRAIFFRSCVDSLTSSSCWSFHFYTFSEYLLRKQFLCENAFCTAKFAPALPSPEMDDSFRKVLSIIYYKSNDKLYSIGSVSFSKIFTLHFDDDDNSPGIGMIFVHIYFFWVKV